MNKILLYFLVLVLLVGPVIAQQGPFTQGNINEPVQLEISVPKVEFMQLDTTFEFHVHVYNASGLLRTNATTDCYLHIYNNSGNHVFAAEMDFDSNTIDFHAELAASDYLTERGLLPYIVWCNETVPDPMHTVGGFFSGSIPMNDRTDVGYNDDTTQGISISLFFLFATIIIFLFPKLYGDFSNNNMLNLIITRCCYVIGFYLMVMNAGIFSSIAVNAGYATTEIYRYLWLFGTGGYLIMVVIALKTLLYDLPDLWRESANKNRGFD